MAEKQTDHQELNSENIFDEFTDSQDIQNEIKQVEQQEHKDLYYYLKHLNTVFICVNVLVFFIVITMFSYNYIQKQETKTSYNFLAPICSIFLWDVNKNDGNCYSVSSMLNEYQNKLTQEQSGQGQRILPLLWEVYSLENFNLSKKVSFILEKSQKRLRPLEILWEFDRIKNKFSPTDKWEISCYDIFISWWEVNITCESFSSDWNTDIISFEDERISQLSGWGTSISRASSFINFIENLPDSRLEVVEKPETFVSKSIQLGPYTQSTTFQLQLRYIEDFNLSF